MLPVPANLHLRVVVAGLVTAVVALVVLGESAPAHADIAIQPSAVPPGRIVPFTVQGMNDRAPDSTTRVELDFPSSPPIAWVDVVPIPRWSVRIERRAL